MYVPYINLISDCLIQHYGYYISIYIDSYMYYCSIFNIHVLTHYYITI